MKFIANKVLLEADDYAIQEEGKNYKLTNLDLSNVAARINNMDSDETYCEKNLLCVYNSFDNDEVVFKIRKGSAFLTYSEPELIRLIVGIDVVKEGFDHTKSTAAKVRFSKNVCEIVSFAVVDNLLVSTERLEEIKKQEEEIERHRKILRKIIEILNKNSGGVKFVHLVTEIVKDMIEGEEKVVSFEEIENICRTSHEVEILEYASEYSEFEMKKTKMFVYFPNCF